MIRYIPDFILQNYEAKKLSGGMMAYALFFDISDFTPICTQLQKHGKEGAEELSKFLDYVFGEPIRIVERCGGFVSLFAGDAFCGIFPETSDLGVLAAVSAIREYFSDKQDYHSLLGDFCLQVRQTVTFGEIRWQIYEHDLQNEYVFFGEPMRIMAELSSLKEELIFSPEAAMKSGLESFEPIIIEELIIGYRLIDQASTPSLPTLRSESIPTANSAAFLNARYQELRPQNEIRSGGFCFASLEAISIDLRTSALATIQTLADRYGGFVNKYDATDKGLTCIILFGLPISEGKTLERICNFSLEVVEVLPALALGISCGSVYAGYVGSDTSKEYTALGAALNLASRLMSKARPGEVLTDSFLWQELHAVYDYGYLGSLSLKGIDQPLRYYRLKHLAPSQSNRDENRFVGRDLELNQIRNIVDQALYSKENIILYVSGDAGIGKSRLVTEALFHFGTNYLKYHISCDAIVHKPLEAIKQLLRTNFYYNPALPLEAALPMFRALWSQIGNGEAEMRRIESIIASLLGYEWEGSVWSMLPPEERPIQLRKAFLHFMEKLSHTKPILIHLDDGQWLDDESRSYLQAISEAETSHVIIISPCRYLVDGNKADIGLPKHQRYDLELDSLTKKGSKELIKHILRLNEVPDPTLELIYSRSMGNPLFIEQISSYLLETGSLDAKGEIVKELGYLSSFSISDIVSSRIDRLTSQVRECMFNASVLGMEFNIEVLTKMLETDLTQELEAGTKNRIWKELDELRYIFSHILIKDIVYQRMIGDKLKGLHRLAAEAMEIVYIVNLDKYAEEIAYHFELGFEEIKAAEYYDKAGRYYWDIMILSRAESCFQKAVIIWKSSLGVNSKQYGESLFHLGLLRHYLRRFDGLEQLYKEVLQINETILGVENPALSPYINNLGRFYKDIQQYKEAELLLLRSLEIERSEHPNSGEVADRLNNVGHLFSMQNLPLKAEIYYRQAYEIIERYLPPDFWFKSTVLANLGMTLVELKRSNEARPMLDKAYEISVACFGDDHPQSAVILCYLAQLDFSNGLVNKAESLYLKALDIFSSKTGNEHPYYKKTLENLKKLQLHKLDEQSS